MTITIELGPEEEKILTEDARDRQQSVQDYICSLIYQAREHRLQEVGGRSSAEPRLCSCEVYHNPGPWYNPRPSPVVDSENADAVLDKLFSSAMGWSVPEHHDEN